MKFAFACVSLMVFIASTNLVEGQVYSWGGCPDVKLQEDLDLEKYLGTWYEHSATNFLVEAGGSCIYVNYSDLKNDTMTLTNKQVNNVKFLETVSAPIKYLGGGKFDFQISPVKSIFVSRDYNVLYTDYDNCAVIYSCRSLGVTHGTVLALVTRERFPKDEVVEKCRAKIAEQKSLPLDQLKLTVQANCTN